MAATLTVTAVVDLAQRVLDANGIEHGSGRVAPTLSVRTLRYYATSGLLDPTPRVARAAVYGRRHLYQVLAIRRGLAAGRTLSMIRDELAGKSNEELAAYANLDLSLVPDDLGDATAAAPPARFWERQPTTGVDAPPPVATPALRGGTGRGEITGSAASARPAAPPQLAFVTHVVHIGPVSVSLPTLPSKALLGRLERAAQPLLELVAIATPTSAQLAHARDGRPCQTDGYRLDPQASTPSPLTPTTPTRRTS